MALSNKKITAADASSFLTKLSTLREFVSGMGMKTSEDDLSNHLKNSGYNVELALERILLTGNFGSGNSIGNASSSSRIRNRSPASASASRKRGSSTSAPSYSSSTSSSSSSRTPKSNIKRQKYDTPTSSSFSSGGTTSLFRSSSAKSGKTGAQGGKNNGIINHGRRLLLCKRWTVACSKSTRGRVNYGEKLDFTENWRNNNKNITTSTPPSSSRKKANSASGKVGAKPKLVDPMVRFHSESGWVEGTLDKYLCSILSPLLRLEATTTTNNNNNHDDFVPLVSIEGEALMEDRNLVIGSDVPISLSIYMNDPIGFFDLFQQNDDAQDASNTCNKLFFQKKKANAGNNNNNNKKAQKMPSYQTKKAKSSFSEGELAEAAVHLLQWAENGEEMPFGNENENDNTTNNGKDGNGDSIVDTAALKEGSGKDGNNGSSDAINSDNDNDDGDYEENSSQSEQVDELNQLVLSQDHKNTNNNKKSPPELSDPEGFKSGVVLRPYQRQALYWMCQREGWHDEDSEGGGETTTKEGEVDLLAELASSTNNTCSTSNSADNGSSSSIQVLGGNKAISCDCGPVVVNDESLALNALPVIKYYYGHQQIITDEDGNNKNTGKKEKKKYIHHHPLWKRRYLATDDLNSVYAYYFNELLGIASSSPPNPPKQCAGGILADAMGLGKTVMLLSLILITKEAEAEGEAEDVAVDTESKQVKQAMVDGTSLNSERVPKQRKGKVVGKPKEDVVDLSFDNSDDRSVSDDCKVVDDDESWTKERTPTKAQKPSFKGQKMSSKGTTAATLVIAPLSLISQWEEELATKTNLAHMVYYDTTKKAPGAADAFSCVDVVVTTYGTIQSEYVSLVRDSKAMACGGSVSLEPGHNHPLLMFGWKRIILDEAHGIKNPATVVSKACCMLKADTRWCVTGTPIQNSLQDVYGLLKFLRHEPWCEATFWKNAITNSLSGVSTGAGNASGMVNKNNGSDVTTIKGEEKSSEVLAASSAAFSRVKRVLAPIILRRTKDTLTEDGTPILTLPPIDSSIVNVALSPAEREFYNALLERSQSVFEGFINAGMASKSWFAIFSLLQRLRQACDHVSLTVNKKLEKGEVDHHLKDNREDARVESPSNDMEGGKVDDNFLSTLLSKFKKKSKAVANENEDSTSFAKQVAESLSQCVQSSDDYLKNECPICLDEPRVEDAVHTPCAHMFCRECLLLEFQKQQTRSSKKAANAPTLSKVEGGSCPVCHDWVKTSCIIQIKKENGEMVSKYLNPLSECKKENSPNMSVELPHREVVARETLESALNGARSSKLEAILAELDEVWKLDPGSKVLIFSQYLGFLDIIGSTLNDHGVECFRIDGKMTLKERVAMIGKFNKNKPAKHGTSDEEGTICQRGSVFLVSMKAGGVGLNLVAASSVFIIDPWWNQAIEDQCISRIHRIGQQAKVVRVRKFVVTDSVEEKIVSLQGKKKGMANQILSDTDGGSQSDSTKPTMEDFKLLFGR